MRLSPATLLPIAWLVPATITAQDVDPAPSQPANLDFEDMSRESPPEGWYLAGSHPDEYVAITDTETLHSGSGSALISATEATPGGFGTLSQTLDAEPYWAQRLRLSAWIKTEGVEGSVMLWMRVDGQLERQMLGFDNMMDRDPIGSTTDWTKYEIVLDVPPEDSRQILYGVILGGAGRVWVDDVRLESVGHDVETTSMLPEGGMIMEEQ